MSVSPARLVAFEILLRVETQQAYASELLHSERVAALSPADRRLCMELVMGVLRWRSRLDAFISNEVSRPLRKLDIEVLTALRLGVYQIGWLARVPPHAAVNESVELAKHARKRSAVPLVNAVLRHLQQPAVLRPEADPVQALYQESTEPDLKEITGAIVDSCAHPPWLVERWVAHYGPTLASLICRYDQQIPATVLSGSAGAELTESELRGYGIELSAGALLRSTRRVTSGDPTQTPAYAEGRLFIQDEGSQLVAALVGHGGRILDCCAAPGGKTAAIAARNPQAEIVAVDLHEHRARLMRRLIRAPNVRVIAADARDLPVAGEFDRVLVDVPCSGTGTLARNPEIKWKLQPEDLVDLHSRQVAILRAAFGHLARHGRLVYSSCSLEPEENEAVIAEALGGTEAALTAGYTSASGIRLLNCRERLRELSDEGELAWSQIDSLLQGPFLRTVPGAHPCDGFFAAVLEKL